MNYLEFIKLCFDASVKLRIPYGGADVMRDYPEKVNLIPTVNIGVLSLKRDNS